MGPAVPQFSAAVRPSIAVIVLAGCLLPFPAEAYAWGQWKAWVSELRSIDFGGFGYVMCHTMGTRPRWTYSMKIAGTSEPCIEIKGTDRFGGDDTTTSGTWAEATGSLQSSLDIRVEFEAWEEDVGTCQKSSVAFCQTTESKDQRVTEAAPSSSLNSGSSTTVQIPAASGEHHYMKLTWRWVAVNCKGGTNVTGADTSCDDVAPGGWCKAKCTALYVQNEAMYDCDAKNVYEGNTVRDRGTPLVCNLLPTVSPTSPPTRGPTRSPTTPPSPGPSTPPTRTPSQYPSTPPSPVPTKPPLPPGYPTSSPVVPPTLSPTLPPTVSPSVGPTVPPSTQPTRGPTLAPSRGPTAPPTTAPSHFPTSVPTGSPTAHPTGAPSRPPTTAPSAAPSAPPSRAPVDPTAVPTAAPTTQSPTIAPSKAPTVDPSISPTGAPTSAAPSSTPTTAHPSVSPTVSTSAPSRLPTQAQPSRSPTAAPATTVPTAAPSAGPTPMQPPTRLPSVEPSSRPSERPSRQPSSTPPSAAPSYRPSELPSSVPTEAPVASPSQVPTSQPSAEPSVTQTWTPTALSPGTPSLTPTVPIPAEAPFTATISATLSASATLMQARETPPGNWEPLPPRGGLEVAVTGLAAMSATAPAVGQLMLASESGCNPLGTMSNLSFALHPTGIETAGSVFLGCLVGNTMLIAGAALFSLAALLAMKRADRDRDGILSKGDLEQSCMRRLPAAVQRAVQRAVQDLNIGSAARCPNTILAVAIAVYQGTCFAALRLLVAPRGNDGSSSPAGLRVLGAVVALALLALPVQLSRFVRRGVAACARTDYPGLGPRARARIRPWDEPAPPRWMQCVLFSELGEWVSCRKGRHWVMQWGTVVRNYKTSSATTGALVELHAMWALSLANAFPTPSWAACGHVRLAGAAVHLAQLAFCVRRFPYRCRRDNITRIMVLALLSGSLLGVAVPHYIIAGDYDGLSEEQLAARSAPELDTSVSSGLLMAATAVVLFQSLTRGIAAILLIVKGWRSQLQRNEWAEFDELVAVREMRGVETAEGDGAALCALGDSVSRSGDSHRGSPSAGRRRRPRVSAGRGLEPLTTGRARRAPGDGGRPSSSGIRSPPRRQGTALLRSTYTGDSFRAAAGSPSTRTRSGTSWRPRQGDPARTSVSDMQSPLLVTQGAGSTRHQRRRVLSGGGDAAPRLGSSAVLSRTIGHSPRQSTSLGQPLLLSPDNQRLAESLSHMAPALIDLSDSASSSDHASPLSHRREHGLQLAAPAGRGRHPAEQRAATAAQRSLSVKGGDAQSFFGLF
eukprot:TRINITY_DN14054_c0_g1_i2.p1 TRINITY_DN14054_c0_g1~~TRINITY_DN14054_c0_g1_i2.p1  ORF type:complete len:1292 (+),score=110.17 TRINITY_DN14054_c0_g1_i2:81-3956(+)